MDRIHYGPRLNLVSIPQWRWQWKHCVADVLIWPFSIAARWRRTNENQLRLQLAVVPVASGTHRDHARGAGQILSGFRHSYALCWGLSATYWNIPLLGMVHNIKLQVQLLCNFTYFNMYCIFLPTDFVYKKLFISISIVKLYGIP
jgi:hypothetical protein